MSTSEPPAAPPVLRFDPLLPKCSRCQIVYGRLELTLSFPDGHVAVIEFHHRPGCRWIGAKSGKNLREWLVNNGYLPTFH